MDLKRRIAPAAAALVPTLLLALLLTLAVRESYWMDEGYTLRRVEAAWPQLYNPFLIEPVENSTHPFDRREVFDLNPPLYFALTRLLAGPTPGRLAMRLFSALPMVLALLLIAHHVRSAFGPASRWAVLLLGASAPASIYYGHEARPYAMPLAMVCLLIWLAGRLRERPLPLFMFTALTAAAGLLTHFAFGWWVLTQGLIFAFLLLKALEAENFRFQISNLKSSYRAPLAVLLGLAAGALVALAVLVPQFSIFTRCRYASSWILSPQVLMATTALPYCRVGAHPTPPAAGFALQAALLMLTLGLLRRAHRRQAGLIALTSWLLPLALPIIAKSWFGVAFIERYTFATLAGWLMTLAWVAGEAAARRGVARTLSTLLLAAMLLTNLAWGTRNLALPMRPPWRPAIDYLKSHATARDLYTVDPYNENHNFAANADTPPPTRYVNVAGGMPPVATALWVLANESSHPKWDQGRLDPKLWKVEHVLELWGLDLFRVSPAPKQ